MDFNPAFLNYNAKNKKINWRIFPLFLIICLLLGIILLYFIFPSHFSGEQIKKIPIIIDNNRERVLSYIRNNNAEYKEFFNASKLCILNQQTSSCELKTLI